MSQLKELVKKELKDGLTDCSLTLDAWVSDATEGYLGVTCHFIDNDFQFRSFILSHKPMMDSHTSQYIHSKLEEVIEEWVLSEHVL